VAVQGWWQRGWWWSGSQSGGTGGVEKGGLWRACPMEKTPWEWGLDHQLLSVLYRDWPETQTCHVSGECAVSSVILDVMKTLVFHRHLTV
jgi:hypothetical protein